LTFVRVAQSSEAKIALAVVQLEHGEVGLLVQADDLRLVLAAVGVTTSMSVARSTTWRW